MAKRICPFCKEEIKRDAIICKHCKSELPALPPEKGGQAWKGFILIMFILFILFQVFKEPTRTQPSNSGKKTVQNRTVQNETVQNRTVQSVIDEKKLLQSDNYFGNFVNPIIKKESGNVFLKRWQPYVDWAKTFNSTWRDQLLEGQSQLKVEYDEIWEDELDDAYTEQGKIEMKGAFDIFRLYWKDNKIQGGTYEKKYATNPLTNAHVNKYVITKIYNRNEILRRLATD